MDSENLTAGLIRRHFGYINGKQVYLFATVPGGKFKQIVREANRLIKLINRDVKTASASFFILPREADRKVEVYMSYTPDDELAVMASLTFHQSGQI
jgi:hypothetical protein